MITLIRPFLKGWEGLSFRIKKPDYTDKFYQKNLCNLYFKICVIFFYFLFLNIFLLKDGVSADSKENSNSEQKRITATTTANEPVRLSLDNFLGKDTSIRATGRLTENYLYLKTGVEKRHIFDTPYFVGIDGSGRHWNENEFDLKGEGGDLYLGRFVTKFTKASINYRFNRVDISNTDSSSAIDFSRHDGTHDVSSLSFNLERSTTDDPFYPKQGTELEFIGEYALKSLGGDFNFSKYEMDADYFFTPFLDVTFCAHTRVGWMEDFGTSRDVPFFERYFAGSSSTVRGFKWGRAGPMSLQNNPLGGDILTTLNLEARYPLYKKWTGAIFFDTGRAFNKMDEFDHFDFRESAGLGIRYLTPWVVLRADYGFIIDKKKDEDIGKLHLTLGMPF